MSGNRNGFNGPLPLTELVLPHALCPKNYSSTRCTANLCSGKLTMQEKVKKYDRAVVIFKVMSKDSQLGKTIFSRPKATQ